MQKRIWQIFPGYGKDYTVLDFLLVLMYSYYLCFPKNERPTSNVQLSTPNEKQKANKIQCILPFIERWMLNVERSKFIFLLPLQLSNFAPFFDQHFDYTIRANHMGSSNENKFGFLILKVFFNHWQPVIITIN